MTSAPIMSVTITVGHADSVVAYLTVLTHAWFAGIMCMLL